MPWFMHWLNLFPSILFLVFFSCQISIAESPKVYRMILQFNYISSTYIMTGKKKKALHQKTKTLSGEFWVQSADIRGDSSNPSWHFYLHTHRLMPTLLVVDFLFLSWRFLCGTKPALEKYLYFPLLDIEKIFIPFLCFHPLCMLNTGFSEA